jgi:hypothetical protein
MKTRHLVPALLFAAGLTPLSALDLTPPSKSTEPAFRVLEDTKIPIVVFPDGNRRVQWQPPADWELRGNATLLSLRPPGASKAAMELRVIPIAGARAPQSETASEDLIQGDTASEDLKQSDTASEDLKQSDTASEDLIQWARPFLPADARRVVFVREVPSPFLLGGLPSREVTFTYLSFARYCTTSIALVDLDDEHSMAIVISAPKSEFAAIRTAGIESMFRWKWIGPTPDRPAGGSPGGNNPADSSVVAAPSS